MGQRGEGSPALPPPATLFNERGQIVALHNSWDSTAAMRHAVPQQTIVHFLTRHKVPFTAAK